MTQRNSDPDAAPRDRRQWLAWASPILTALIAIISVVYTQGTVNAQLIEQNRRIGMLEQTDREREPLLRDLLVKLGRIEAKIEMTLPPSQRSFRPLSETADGER